MECRLELKALKNIKKIVISKRHSLIVASAFMAICLATIALSDGMMFRNQPDSAGYIKFSAIRSSAYPMFIRLHSYLFSEIDFLIVSQVILYSLSFFYLMYIIHERLGNIFFVSISFGIGISLNIYLQAYHLVILTESLVFTLMNVFLACFIKLKDQKNLSLMILLGIIAGSLFALKPAMITMILILPFVMLYLGSKDLIICSKSIFVTLLATLSIVIVERAIYRNFHDQNRSLLPLTLQGKAAILTSYSDFVYPSIDKDQTSALIAWDKTLTPFEAWSSGERNKFLVRNLTSNFEVLSQYGEKNLIERYNVIKLTDKQKVGMGISTILANPRIYLKHSMGHMISLWSVHELAFMGFFSGLELPQFSDKFLQSAVPGDGAVEQYLDPNSINAFSLLSIVVFPMFLSLGVINFFILTLHGFRIILSAGVHTIIISQKQKLVFVLSGVGWLNLVFVAFVNISSPRYLMPVLPFILLATLISISDIFEKLRTLRSVKC
jgi:hypothetical protein